MDNLINREAAKAKRVYSEERHEYVVPVASLDWLPTIDAMPVVHARWVSRAKKVTCSHCGSFADWTSSGGWWEQIERPFCPSCGAKMDLPRGEEAQA